MIKKNIMIYATYISLLGLSLTACSAKQYPIENETNNQNSKNYYVDAPPTKLAQVYPIKFQDSQKQVVTRELNPDWRPKLYTVKKGDTLYSISLEHGFDYKDVADWNNLSNRSQIKIGQLLKLSPPPINTKKPSKNSNTQTAKTQDDDQDFDKNFQFDPNQVTTIQDEITWTLPTLGKIVATFNEAKGLKGVDIVGQSGQPIFAVSSGKVVYSGTGLRGYGKLIIIKHSKIYLSAYAHNSKILVREGQIVHRGDKIAEMGSTDSEIVKLHFEIRKYGKPIDPISFLPKI